MVTFSTERMKETTDGSQLCIINNNLYLKYKLNDADIIGYVDTGMGGEKNLVIYNEYYQRHKKSLPRLLSDDTHEMCIRDRFRSTPSIIRNRIWTI